MDTVLSRLSALRLPSLRLSTPLRIWLLCWIVLPNLAFCMLWAIAAPPRMEAIFATGIVGLIVRHASYPVRVAGFAGVIGFSVLSYISAIFNLSVTEVFISARFFMELDPLRSPTYALALALMAGMVTIAAWLLRRDTRFSSVFELAVAITAVLGMVAFDTAVSHNSRGAYKRLPAADARFESAVTASGLMAHADGRRNVLVVMTESTGSPTNPVLEQLMLGRWRAADIAARYDVRFGTTAYYGSTTSAEIRELCGRWDDYGSVKAAPDAHCLPARLQKQGYDTTAVHGFVGAFFDRADWYPNIGFERAIFGERLTERGADTCPGVFAGACDDDVPAQLAPLLRAQDKPQFVYWLTLNSHLPVVEADILHTRQCLERHPGFPVDSDGLCRLVSVTRRTNDHLARVLLDPALPPTDILIVGDHMPPFFDHLSRSQFDPHRVSWVLLTTRGE